MVELVLVRLSRIVGEKGGGLLERSCSVRCSLDEKA